MSIPIQKTNNELQLRYEIEKLLLFSKISRCIKVRGGGITDTAYINTSKLR